MVDAPMLRSKRQSNGVAGLTNSSESHVPRQSLTVPIAPSSTILFISDTAGSRR